MPGCLAGPDPDLAQNSDPRGLTGGTDCGSHANECPQGPVSTCTWAQAPRCSGDLDTRRGELYSRRSCTYEHVTLGLFLWGKGFHHNFGQLNFGHHNFGSSSLAVPGHLGWGRSRSQKKDHEVKAGLGSGNLHVRN